MTAIGIGFRFWKMADREYVWVGDGVVRAKDGEPAYTLVVNGDGLNAEDVGFSHLADPGQFTPIS